MRDTRHVMPVTADGEPEHRTDGFCWCQPIAEDVGLSGRIYIHRRSLDSPHREVACGVRLFGYGECALEPGHEGVHEYEAMEP